MTNEEKGMGKGLLIGVFAGAAVGSIFALLYAPKSGKKLREDIKTKSQDLIEDADQYISGVKEKAFQLIKDVKKKSEFLVSDAEEKVDALMYESEKNFNDAKNKVGNYIQSAKIKIDKENEHLKSCIKAGKDAYQFEKEAR
jgi:gas vesicle protein